MKADTQTQGARKLIIDYKNHRGITKRYEILPEQLWFGNSPWHEGAQWFIRARDTERGLERDFAVLDIIAFGPSIPEVRSLGPRDKDRMGMER